MDNPEKLATQDKRQRQTKPKHNTLCVRHHYSQQSKKQNIKKDMSPPTSNWR
jgi:hypothetical protein